MVGIIDYVINLFFLFLINVCYGSKSIDFEVGYIWVKGFVLLFVGYNKYVRLFNILKFYKF